MFDFLNLRQGIQANVDRLRGMKHRLLFHNTFTAELWRDGKLIFRTQGHNDIVTEGKNHILDVCFGNSSPVTQVDPWYIGIINNTPTPTLLAADTLASHTGWAELVAGTDYTGNRQAWTDANATGGAKGTDTVSTFPILTTKTAYGILICSAASGTSGTLWATGAFDEAIPLSNGDNLKINYSLSF